MNFSNKKICFFDLDGTLVDSMGAFADIAAEVIERVHKVPFDKARASYMATSGIPFFQQLELLFPGAPANHEIAAEFEQRKLAGFHSDRYFPDVGETIKWLRSSGLKTVVSSNNFENNVEQFVAHRGVEFDYVLGFRDGFAKGADHFDYVAEVERVRPGDMVFVGDSLKDGERAYACGVDFVGRTGTFSREQFNATFPNAPVIDTLSELKILFERR